MKYFLILFFPMLAFSKDQTLDLQKIFDKEPTANEEEYKIKSNSNKNYRVKIKNRKNLKDFSQLKIKIHKNKKDEQDPVIKEVIKIQDYKKIRSHNWRIFTGGGIKYIKEKNFDVSYSFIDLQVGVQRSYNSWFSFGGLVSKGYYPEDSYKNAYSRVSPYVSFSLTGKSNKKSLLRVRKGKETIKYNDTSGVKIDLVIDQYLFHGVSNGYHNEAYGINLIYEHSPEDYSYQYGLGYKYLPEEDGLRMDALQLFFRLGVLP